MTQTLSLLVGALVAETQPVLSRMTNTKKLGRSLYVGYLSGARVAVYTCGVGPIKAEHGTKATLGLIEKHGFKVGQVVSFGTCGSLVEELSIGDLVCARSLATGKSGGDQIDAIDGLRAVNVVTVDRAVTTSAEREELANNGFQVCEMEAAGVFRAAAGRPFGVIKVVSDTAGGDPEDEVIAKGPRPVRIARFMIRARLLSEAHLVGALSELVSGVL